MARAGWTYQVAPAGAPSAGLEEYAVEAASGERVGKVQTLLRRDEEILVAVERGTPPVTHDVRVVPWRDVESVDHAGLTVRLKVAEADVDQALELDPDKGVEVGDAEAVRVTELPAELRPSSAPTDAGPTDRGMTGPAIALGLVGVFSLLVVVIVASATDFTWEFALFVIPAVLLLLAGVVGYRLFRNPYERR